MVSDCQLPTVQPSDKLRLVYVTEGNLWLLDEGKEPVQMMDSGDVEQVMLSLDGSQIVIVRRRNADNVEIWAVNSSGWRQLTNGQGITGSVELISFSSDQQLVVFSRLLDDVEDLWVADLGSPGVRRLVSGEKYLSTPEAVGKGWGVSLFEVKWMPGTHRITFAYSFSSRGGADGYGPPPDHLVIVDADTGEQEVLFPNGEGGYITYSPDGRFMVIANRSNLRLFAVDNLNQPQTIRDYEPACADVGCYLPQPVWRPDSSSVLFILPSEEWYLSLDPGYGLAPYTVWEASVEGGSVRKLSEFSSERVFFFFSPDVRQMAYFRANDTESILNLRVTSVDGAQQFSYDSTPDGQFDGWAPDSRHFAFGLADGELKYGDICGNVIRLTELADAQVVGWVDATRFLMEVGPWGDWDLYLGTAEGKSTRLVEFGTSVIYDYVVMHE